MDDSQRNFMSYKCPNCGHIEKHFSESLAHPQQGVYDITPIYTCPKCNSELFEYKRVDGRPILRG